MALWPSPPPPELLRCLCHDDERNSAFPGESNIRISERGGGAWDGGDSGGSSGGGDSTPLYYIQLQYS